MQYLGPSAHEYEQVSRTLLIVAEVAKRIVLVTGGNIVADGPTREIFERTEILAKAQIRPPQITQLAQALGDCGVRRNLMTVREAADSIGAMIAQGKGWSSRLA